MRWNTSSFWTEWTAGHWGKQRERENSLTLVGLEPCDSRLGAQVLTMRPPVPSAQLSCIESCWASVCSSLYVRVCPFHASGMQSTCAPHAQLGAQRMCTYSTSMQWRATKLNYLLPWVRGSWERKTVVIVKGLRLNLHRRGTICSKMHCVRRSLLIHGRHHSVNFKFGICLRQLTQHWLQLPPSTFACLAIAAFTSHTIYTACTVQAHMEY